MPFVYGKYQTIDNADNGSIFALPKNGEGKESGQWLIVLNFSGKSVGVKHAREDEGERLDGKNLFEGKTLTKPTKRCRDAAAAFGGLDRHVLELILMNFECYTTLYRYFPK